MEPIRIAESVIESWDNAFDDGGDSLITDWADAVQSSEDVFDFHELYF